MYINFKLYFSSDYSINILYLLPTTEACKYIYNVIY